jgi:tRNA (guanine-N7-)-methyltransferase
VAVERTYLRRRGRITRGQQRALQRSKWVLTPDEDQADWGLVFGRRAPLGLEIGFGAGHALGRWAVERPDADLIGIELYQPGIGSLLLELERYGLGNVRVLEGEAATLLERRFRPASLAEIRIYFPDPWPKRRHHKRRLIQAPFVALLASRLEPAGVLRIATDWEPYALWIRAHCAAEPGLVNRHAGFAPDAGPRLETRFERRGRAAGRRVWELCYERR